MDALDSKILQMLDWNGRIPLTRLARQLRASKEVVAYRVNKLQESGVIRRYYPVLDMCKLGYFTSRIMFDLEELNEKEEQAFVEFLDKEIGAGLIFRMDYPYRWGIFAWTKSVYDVENIIVRIKGFLGSKVLGYNYSLICTFRQYPKDYIFGKKYHDLYRSLEPTASVAYDKEDYRILKELAANARASTAEISRETGIPQTTISQKIKAMERKKIIIGYRAELDFIKLGFTNWFLHIYLDKNDNMKDIEKWANGNPHVVWLQKIIGMCDIEIEVEMKNRTELEKLLQELRQRFKNIRKIVFFSQEYRKLTFLP